MPTEWDNYSPDQQFQCVLEVSRQLHDTQKSLTHEPVFLHWDAGISLDNSIGCYGLHTLLVPYVRRGALRYQRIEPKGRLHVCYSYWLPRRRSRLCPLHQDACLPTRETVAHRTEALTAWQSSTHQWPTFLVDLLDPWPRGWDAPAKSKRAVNAITDTLRYHVMHRDYFQCQLCGARVQDNNEVRLTVDHKRSVAMGGTNDPDNLWTLCRVCNSGKGTQSL